VDSDISGWVWAGLGVAFALACLYCWLELSETHVSSEFRRRLRRLGAQPVMPRFLTRRMTHLIAFRMLVDGVLGAAAYVVLAYPAFHKPHGVVAVIAGGVGGLIGPSVARSSTLGLDDTKKVDINARYRKLVSRLDRRIGNRSASEQTRWLETKAMPAFASLSLDELLTLLCSFADNLGQQQVLTKSDELKSQLRSVAGDSSSTEGEIRRGLLQLTLDAGGLDFLRDHIRNP
jgi:hypothetical protein